VTFTITYVPVIHLSLPHSLVLKCTRWLPREANNLPPPLEGSHIDLYGLYHILNLSSATDSCFIITVLSEGEAALRTYTLIAAS